jgi:hypothetical protein
VGSYRSRATVKTSEAKIQPRPEGTQRGALKVAIIEDQSAIRLGLQILINGSPRFRCTGAFGTMEEALAITVYSTRCAPGLAGTC